MFQKIMQIDLNLESILSIISGFWTLFFVFVICGYTVGHDIEVTIGFAFMMIFVLGLGFFQIVAALFQRKEIYWIGVPLYITAFVLFYLGMGYIITLLAFVSASISIAKLIKYKFFLN